MEYIYDMLYKLKSPYPCLVVAGQQHAELTPADTLEIDGNGLVYVYPHVRRMWPFCINLAAPRECEHFSIFRQQEATFLILEGLNCVKVSQTENFSFGGKNCVVEVDDEDLRFSFGGKTIQIGLENAQKYEKSMKIGSFVLAQFEDDAYVFCTKTGKVSHFGGAVEVNGNRVKVCKKFADGLLRQRNATFVLDSNLSLESENFVRSNSVFAQENPSDKENANFVPYQFMESVKAKDYEYAAQFLSEKLRHVIGKDEFAEFFGNFSTFLPLSALEFITICGKEKNFVRFSLFGNKVDDISIDKL